MNFGRRHYDIAGFDGLDAVLAAVLPSSWWIRIIAVRLLRHMGMVPKRNVLSLMFNPYAWTFREKDGYFRWMPTCLPRGELTFMFRNRCWEVRDFAGRVELFIPAPDPVFVSAH